MVNLGCTYSLHIGKQPKIDNEVLFTFYVRSAPNELYRRFFCVEPHLTIFNALLPSAMWLRQGNVLHLSVILFTGEGCLADTPLGRHPPGQTPRTDTPMQVPPKKLSFRFRISLSDMTNYKSAFGKVCRIKNRQTFRSMPILNSAYFTAWYAELRIGILLKVCRFLIRHTLPNADL